MGSDDTYVCIEMLRDALFYTGNKTKTNFFQKNKT